MVIIKQHIVNVKLNEVEKMSLNFSQSLRDLIVFSERLKRHPKSLISRLVDPAELVNTFTDSLASQEKAHEKIHSDFQAWEAEAKKLFQAAEKTTYGNLNQLETYLQSNPPSAGAIALLLFVVQDKFKSDSASKRAQSPRKKGEKVAALQLWNDWQKNLDSYKNKQAFIKQVTATKPRAVPISSNTARAWFDEFRVNEFCSQAWENLHGKNYPMSESKARLEHKPRKKSS